MILFLPINVYRAHYQVAKGRPYSAFERILLLAVAGDQDRENPASEPLTTAVLATDLCVPERLVIEGVATLLEAEWIALDEANLLVVTAAGRRALVEPDRLPPDMDLREYSAWIVQERVCGQTILQEGVSYERRDKLEKEGRWDKEQALPPADSVPSSLDPGQVVPLLHVSDSAYLSWVGPVDIHHSGDFYLIVTVNPDKEVIANLPRAWEAALRDHLISHARFLRDERRERGVPEPNEAWVRSEYQADREAEPTPAAWQVPADSLKFLRSVSEHRDLLMRTFEEDDYLFIASTTLSDSVIRPQLPAFLSALGRGATIDILFGNDEGASGRPALDLLKKLAYDSARQGSGGRLLVNHSPSGCHANVLLRARYSKGHTTAEAVFGSHRWLADPIHEESAVRSLSLLMTHEAPVAYLSRTIFLPSVRLL